MAGFAFSCMLPHMEIQADHSGSSTCYEASVPAPAVPLASVSVRPFYPSYAGFRFISCLL